MSERNYTAPDEIRQPSQSWVTNETSSLTESPIPDEAWITEPLPESTRPRKDGPGGDGE